MRAMLLQEYKKLELVEMPMPQIGPNDLLVRVKACGICGSDIHGYDGSTGRRVPPLVMGHEAAGIVEEKGSQVTGFEVGDRVTFDSTVSCGRCASCAKGRINLCENRQVLGVPAKSFVAMVPLQSSWWFQATLLISFLTNFPSNMRH